MLHNGDLRKYSVFITGLLHYYCMPEQRNTKDTFIRRIHNSVLLLVEAHRQRNGAIALALYCTAIEALLTRKGGQGDVAAQLADHVATLLEPDLGYRADAVSFVKKLYDVRSWVLHGERIASEDHEIRNARCLICALLEELLYRVDHMCAPGGAPLPSRSHVQGWAPRNPGRLSERTQRVALQ